MKLFRIFLFVLSVLLPFSAMAQSWSSAYEDGLKAAKEQKWSEARAAFQQAIAYRLDDQSSATTLPGPLTEQRKWRDGAPYSPNFLAAYAAIKLASSTADADAKSLYETAAMEFEALIIKGQTSPETIYFLDSIYDKLNAADKKSALISRVEPLKGKFNWKVDRESIAADDIANVAKRFPEAAPVVKPTEPSKTNSNTLNTVAAPPAPSKSKFALVIGNSESKLPDGGVKFALTDAEHVKKSLVANSGYPADNIDLALNVTAQEILVRAKALSERVADGGTVLIYFTGRATNVTGKDYLIGIDTEILTDTSSMVAKTDLYRVFFEKGAAVFAFYQTERKVRAGRYFGQEIAEFGMISQSQSTLPDGKIQSLFVGNQEIGLYTFAFTSVLDELKSSRIPITEFGWQVYYRMRRGMTGTQGGSSRQTSTLPSLSLLASDARF